MTKLNMTPGEFWKMTFAEFYPVFNAISGNYIKPLDHLELEGLEEAWAKVGNS